MIKLKKTKILRPLRALIIAFIVMFICGLNWWRVIGDKLSLLGTVICIAAAAGAVICIVLSSILSKLIESVDEELYALRKNMEKQNK